MKPSAWHRLDEAARAVSPFAVTVLLALFSVIPQRAPDIAPVMPALVLIAVYFWSVFRPDLMPFWAIFLVGVVQDLLTGIPLGAGIVPLLLVHGYIGTQRRFFASATMPMLWIVFALVAAVALALTWVLSCLVLGALVDPTNAALQYLTTIAAYPCVAWLFAQAQMAFLSEQAPRVGGGR